MSLPAVSVVIPTYNRSDIVAKTLEHLIAVDYSGNYEILVADNSTDDTPEMVTRVAATASVPVRLIRSNDRLPAVKRNKALRAALGDIVIFMNDDLWVTRDFVQEHAATHERHNEPVAVVGYVEQSPQMPYDPFTEWYRPFAYHEIDHLPDRDVGFLYSWSMNLSMPREVMLKRNLVFHEDWAEIGHEDVELGYRWQKAGLSLIYNPRARGEHYHPHTLDSACRLQESIGRGLRDLERLIPEPWILERYGVFSWRNSGRSVARGIARKALFNRLTVPVARRWLNSRRRNSDLSRWMYWKVLLHHTERGYNSAPTRHLTPTPTFEPVAP